MNLHRRFFRLDVFVRLLLVGSLAAPVVWAQEGILNADTLVFEQLGDQPFSGVDDFDFAPDGTLYALSSEIYALAPDSEVWEEISEWTGALRLLVLDADTLVASDGGRVFWSLDGGSTWGNVLDDYGDALFETALGGPHAGLLLTGVIDTTTGVAYSTDRGATWSLGVFDVPPDTSPMDMVTFAAFPEGHPWENRLIAGGFGGLVYSDDNGQTWQTSNVWQRWVSLIISVAVGTDGTAYALGGHEGFVGVFASTDGATWEERSEGNEDFSFWYGHLVAIPGTPGNPDGGLLYVMKHPAGEDGDEPQEIWLSTDGGWTWKVVGRLPIEDPFGHQIKDALLGPDGHLYVAVSRAGGGWSYRTTEPVTVPIAGEEGPERPEGLALTAHPNPSAGVVEVGLELTEPEEARIAVFDLRGREVAQLHEGSLPAGEHAFAWESAGVAAGVYVVRAEVGEARVSRRVTLAK